MGQGQAEREQGLQPPAAISVPPLDGKGPTSLLL